MKRVRESRTGFKIPRIIRFTCNPRAEDHPAKRNKNAGENDKHEEKNRPFKTFSSPSSLMAAISKLNETQKKAVEDIGFGGLLRISISKVPKDLLGWLLQRFRPRTRTVECNKSGLQYKVGWADVRDVFLLPHNSKQPVLEWIPFRSSPDITDIRGRWEREYGIPSSSSSEVSLSHLLREMLKLEDGGDDFKRMFVLYVLSSFLVPASNKNVQFSALKSLLKVDEIKNLDWCEHVIEHLCNAVHSWQEAESKENVGGCLLLLQLSYLHRHSCIPRSLPLVQHWNTQNMKDIIDEELNSGGFGLGDFNLDEYPISKEAGIEEEIPRTIDDDATPKNKNPEGPSYMDRIFREIHEIKCKLDALGAGALKEGKATDSELKSGSKEMEIVDNGNKEIVDDEDGLKKDSIELIDLCGSEKDNDQAGDLANKDDQHATFNLNKDNGSRVEPEAVQVPHPQANLPNNDDIEVLSVKYGTDTLSKSDCDEVLYILKATRQEIFVTKLLRTYPFKMKRLRNYEAQIADFCISRSNSFPPTLPVFNDNYYTSANAVDFTTLEFGKDISTFIINSWARLLNAAQFDPSMPSKLCLKVISAFDNLNVPTAILFKHWDYFLESCSRNVLNADLIFVPVHMNAHFFLLVVNFKNRLVQYLDNLRHDKHVTKKYEVAVEAVKNVISSFLEHHKHPEAEAVKNYEVQTIEGKWRTSESDHDSGLYAMYHMDTFTGKSDDIDESLIMKADSRNVLRAKFCTRLILSPVNTCMRDVLSGVSNFNGDKSSGKITD